MSLRPFEISADERARRLIVIGASAGGFPAITRLIAALPTPLKAAVIVLQHRMPTKAPVFESLLSRWSALPLSAAADGVPVQAGHIYVAPADCHLVITPDRTFAHHDGTRIRGTLASLNPLLESAAAVYGVNAIAVILTGAGRDGTDGVQTVKREGGIVIVESPSTAWHVGMPQSAVDTGVVDFVLPLAEIGPLLGKLIAANHPIDNATAG